MHAQKQCISPNRNDGMKYRDKMYCFQVVETEPNIFSLVISRLSVTSLSVSPHL